MRNSLLETLRRVGRAPDPRPNATPQCCNGVVEHESWCPLRSEALEKLIDRRVGVARKLDRKEIVLTIEEIDAARSKS